MKQRFTLFRRNGTFYCEDTETRKQISLRTKNSADAKTLLHAKNEAYRQPILNLQIARAYLTAADPEMATRTWRAVMDEMAKTKKGPTLDRFVIATRDDAYKTIRDLPILETKPQQLFQVMQDGTVSTQIFLRRFHNFALDMSWLPWPIPAKKQWPQLHFKEKRAITLEEHQKIIAREKNPEDRAFYELCWHPLQITSYVTFAIHCGIAVTSITAFASPSVGSRLSGSTASAPSSGSSFTLSALSSSYLFASGSCSFISASPHRHPHAVAARAAHVRRRILSFGKIKANSASTPVNFEAALKHVALADRAVLLAMLGSLEATDLLRSHHAARP